MSTTAATSFDTVLGAGRGRRPRQAEPPASPCPGCRGSGVARTGYHGPPGDDRGYLPCRHCRPGAFTGFRGDWMRGVSFTDAYRLVHGPYAH